MTIHGVLSAILIGLVVGALGRLVVPGKQRIPIWLTIVVGIGAALLGTLLADKLGIPTATPGVDWMELLVQVVLAAIGVAIVAGVYGPRSRLGGGRTGVMRR
ncbi:GlsB/YeaQ/YmgE family stress response membrane protein [Mycobacterium bourgelatii]|uniref:Transglycosylase n=1 Tax=Mycobacterium bourgelatii TaxID=1273442 RepID=A0A7I9YHR4_MYCBU|nr:GlsB/YeaQ/YmgE family stress response membrane protein [Mycobacterium bourgelatii]MCV6976791.1 GlsB/YeaQ/YmgE family stress response membrane protein [Mycobacterium bourgelatii]GFG88082.1 transglycosylase [Mycobacterium bourgelatii]